MSLIENIKKSEGFVGYSYKDSLGYETIGYGTKLPLSQNESELILKSRIELMIMTLRLVKADLLDHMPEEKREVIYEMCYQLGVNGLLKFKNMWIALEKGDYLEASIHMLDSRWAKQTPRRARKLSEKMRS